EVGLQGRVVLDDPVMDQDDAGPVIAVGVGVVLGDAAVGCPAGVGQAQRPLEAPGLLELLLQHADAPDGAADVDLAVEDRDPGRVVAPVLQALEALDQEGPGLLVPDVGDDPAHWPAPPGPTNAGRTHPEPGRGRWIVLRRP